MLPGQAEVTVIFLVAFSFLAGASLLYFKSHFRVRGDSINNSVVSRTMRRHPGTKSVHWGKTTVYSLIRHN
ncbi:hypothetical protein TWF730_001360 [Orbilia blumenaviensis]|uniref:Uncharacterized protein n=1 Tax=Orbilia blumenaviensis TaxID=1796055 RepID=A0AAV9UHN8_9PEZI